MKALAVVVLAAFAACAHTPDLPLRPDPAPPAGSTTEVFTARDGTPLLARAWLPAGAPRAAVVIMHGLKDHSDRYAALADKLVAHGYVVFAFDLRGHGRSAGPRVAPAHWTDYVDDLDRFLAHVEQRVPDKPVFLFGHSMGGEHAFAAGAKSAGWLLGSLRFGGDRRYWPHARAGVGPVVSAGYECAFASVCGAVVLAGIELYGAD